MRKAMSSVTRKEASLSEYEAGEYARVTATDRENNTVTVKRTQRRGAELRSTAIAGRDGLPRLLSAAFAQGDRVQLTAPYHEEKLANRELGTVRADRQATAI